MLPTGRKAQAVTRFFSQHRVHILHNKYTRAQAAEQRCSARSGSFGTASSLLLIEGLHLVQHRPHPALLADLGLYLKPRLSWLTPGELATLLHSLVCVCVYVELATLLHSLVCLCVRVCVRRASYTIAQPGVCVCVCARVRPTGKGMD